MDAEGVKPDDFLTSARTLVEAAKGRPLPANLRRAISSVYYALFHTLGETCAKMLIGDQATERAWMHVYRALDHRPAKDACNRIDYITRFPDPIQDFAARFVQMQTKRHSADYDPDAFFYKSEVTADIAAAEQVIFAFRKVQGRHRRAFAAYVLLKLPRQ